LWKNWKNKKNLQKKIIKDFMKRKDTQEITNFFAKKAKINEGASVIINNNQNNVNIYPKELDLSCTRKKKKEKSLANENYL
jgi:hypothetical protein